MTTYLITYLNINQNIINMKQAIIILANSSKLIDDIRGTLINIVGLMNIHPDFEASSNMIALRKVVDHDEKIIIRKLLEDSIPDFTNNGMLLFLNSNESSKSEFEEHPYLEARLV